MKLRLWLGFVALFQSVSLLGNSVFPMQFGTKDLRDVAFDAIAASDGGTIVVGQLYQRTSVKEAHHEMFLYKFDSYGLIELAQRIKLDAYPCRAVEVVATSDGGYAFTGWANGNVLVRLDSKGRLLWMKRFEKLYGTWKNLIAGENGSVVTAYGTYENPGLQIHQFSAQGDTDWKYLWTEGAYNSASLAKLPSGYVVVSSDSKPIGPEASKTSKLQRLLLLGLSETGEVKWDKVIEGSVTATSRAITDLTSLPNGDFLIATYFQYNYSEQNKPWLLRISPDGTIKKSLVFKSLPGRHFVYAATALQNGELVFVSRFREDRSSTVYRTNWDGEILGQKRFKDSSFWAVDQYPDGDLLVAGAINNDKSDDVLIDKIAVP